MTPLGNKYSIQETSSFDRVPGQFDKPVDWWFSEDVERWYKVRSKSVENKKYYQRKKK